MAKKSAKRPSRPAAKTGGRGRAAKPAGAKSAGSGKPGGKKRRPAGAKGAPKRAVRKHRSGKGGPARIAPEDAGERLQKVLAAAGVASRRECEELIVEGRVKVDGKIVSELGARVDAANQDIQVDGEPLKQPKRVYFAVNKPEGVVCTANDPSGRQRVTDLIPPNIGRVFNVGRLDMSSEGLILLTNDGELANRLTHPRHGVEKIYHVVVAGDPKPETLAEVRKGVYLDEGRVAFANVKVKTRRKSSSVLEVMLDEGRNREIRRVLARVGHKVQRLQRIAVGPVRLGEMPAGAYRPLTREEVTALRNATSDSKPATKPGKQKPTAKATESQSASKRKRPPRKPALDKRVGEKPAKPAGGRRIIGAEVEPETKTSQSRSGTKKKSARSKPKADSRSTSKAVRGKPTKKAAKKTKPAAKGRGRKR